MKLKLTIFALALFATQAYSQTKNTISLMYAPGSGDVNIHGAIGDFGYYSQGATTFGIGYSHDIKKFFAFETGLVFSTSNIKENYYSGSGLFTDRYDKITMITIPALAKFTFLRYLYVDFGLLLDLQTNYSTASAAPDQSGVGFEGGVGAKYNFGSVQVFVDPYFQYHGLTQFNKGRGFELLNSGVKFGLGYNF